MKKIILIFLIMINGLFALCQDTAYSYFDKDWKESSKRGASFYRKVYKGPGSLWAVEDHYISGTLQMLGTYTDKDVRVKHGKFVYYHPNGQKSSELTYVNDSIEGDYLSYHENGQVNIKYHIEHGVIIGFYESYTEDGLLEYQAEMQEHVQHGLTNYYGPKGKLASTGNYIKGLKTGEWKYYDENGTYIASEFHIGSFKSSCGYNLNFENDKWTIFARDSSTEQLSLAILERRDVYNKKGQPVLFILNIACLNNMEFSGSSDAVALNVMLNKDVKGKKVASINGQTVNLKGGALYYFEEKENGMTRGNYFYTRLRAGSALELFFTFDKKIIKEHLNEIADVINSMTYEP